MTKRTTVHFDFEEMDSPRYSTRHKQLMERLCKEKDLGNGSSPQVFHYPEGSVKIEWESEVWPDEVRGA